MKQEMCAFFAFAILFDGSKINVDEKRSVWLDFNDICNQKLFIHFRALIFRRTFILCTNY